MTRAEATQEIETQGIVAVIRMQDTGRLRAVVDALAAGGVRALEVTMTVPRAIELIRELAPTLPAGFLLGAGTVTDAATGLPLANAKVFVLGTPNADTTGATGLYKTGAAQPGSYTVQAERVGYMTKVMSGIVLSTGLKTTLDIALSPALIGTEAVGNERVLCVFPTLFEDILNVEMPGLSSKARLRLTDFSGSIILENSLVGEKTVLKNLKNLPAGQYLITVLEGGKTVASARVLKCGG